MVGLDEEALICDFVEVYHVFDWRSLPVKMAATLAAGLGEDSRIMRKISGTSVTTETLLLATIADALHVLVWQNTKDGAKGRNRPMLIAEKLTETPKKESGFSSADEFRKWRESVLIGSENEWPDR